jgi:hypothetical protein
MDEPQVRAFLCAQAPAEVAPGPIAGRWIAESEWPPATEERVLHLVPGRLSDTPGAGVIEHRDRGVVGLQTPEWVPFGAPLYPAEQSPDDAGSLVFDSEPLEAPLDLLGTPRLRLRVAADVPAAKLAARLCEVTPDGRCWLVSYGVLNLTHRASHAEPEPLTPGAFYDIDLPLYLTGRRLRAGARLRLALSDSLWPLLWPSPRSVTLSFDLARAVLELPLRAKRASEPAMPIATADGHPSSGRGDPSVARRLTGDGWVEYEEVWPLADSTVTATGTRLRRSGVNVAARMRPGEPDSCHWRAWHVVRYSRGDWDCAVESEVELTASAETFHLRERLVARQGERVVFEREHLADIPRDLM